MKFPSLKNKVLSSQRIKIQLSDTSMFLVIFGSIFVSGASSVQQNKGLLTLTLSFVTMMLGAFFLNRILLKKRKAEEKMKEFFND